MPTIVTLQRVGEDRRPASVHQYGGDLASERTTRGDDMDLFEIDETRRLGREEAAARLHALADALARNNAIEFERDGRRITVRVPDEVDLKIEVEIGDENELEIELTW
jgi:amphi-Trp domain-containing protein